MGTGTIAARGLGEPRRLGLSLVGDAPGIVDVYWRTSAWDTACKRAGLPGLRFHDLRRSAARNLRRAGVSAHTIMKMAGWKTGAMFARYDIVDETDMANATASYDAWLAQAGTTPRKTTPLRAPAV